MHSLARLKNIHVSVGHRPIVASEVKFDELPLGNWKCRTITDQAATGAGQAVANVPCYGAIGESCRSTFVF